RRKAVHNVTGRRTDINTLTVDENTVAQSIRKTFATQQSRVLSDRGGHQIRRSQAVVRTSSRELLVNPSRLTRIWAKRLNAPRIPSARRKAVHNVTGRRTDINTLTVDENT